MKRHLETALITVVVGVSFAIFARLGVDPHHDGMVLQPALVVADGGIVHRDVLEQYGAVTPWIFGLFVRLFGRSLIAIRAGSALILAAAFGLFFTTWRNRYGRAAAYVSLLIAFTTAYFFTPGMDMRAWSSDVLLLIQALSLWLVIGRTREANGTEIAFLGALSGIAGLTRIGPGIAQCFLILIIVIAYKRPRIVHYISGLGVVLGSFLVYVWSVGALGEWWYQTAMMPFEWSTSVVGASPWKFAVGLSRSQLLPVVIGPIATLGFLSSFWRKSTPLLLRMILGVAATLWITNLIRKVDFGYLHRTQVMWIVLTALALIVLTTLFQVLSVRWTDFATACSIVVPLAAATQLYPVVEARHLWWSAVPATGLVVNWGSAMLGNVQAKTIVTALVSVILIQGTIRDSSRNLQIPRTRVTSLPVLRGMYFDSKYFRYFSDNFESLKAYLAAHPDAPMINMCADGLFASLAGSSRMPDAYYVLWSFRAGSISFEDRTQWALKHRPIAWLCPPSPDPTAQSGLFGLRVVPVSDATKSLEHRGEWPYLGVLAVPREWPIPRGARG